MWGYQGHPHRAAHRGPDRPRARHRSASSSRRGPAWARASTSTRSTASTSSPAPGSWTRCACPPLAPIVSTGPWEVNQNVSRGEDFGLGVSYRLGRSRQPPFQISPPDSSHARPLRHPPGRDRRHADGRVVGLLDDGRQLGGAAHSALARDVDRRVAVLRSARESRALAADLGETEHGGHRGRPRAVRTRATTSPATQLQPVWQWNHVPVDGKWSLSERPGFLRLHALPRR